MTLTLFAGLLLALILLPAQRRVLNYLTTDHLTISAPVALASTTAPVVSSGRAAPGAHLTAGLGAPALSRLGMMSGLFALIWVAVVCLMILRPGSTTGV